MKNLWKPRSERWTSAERKEKEHAARFKREFERMCWLEKNKIRIQIEKEIENIKLARIASLE